MLSQKMKKKIKKSRDLIKIDNNTYIKVERNKSEYKIFKIEKCSTLFSDNIIEMRTELVPKSDNDLNTSVNLLTNIMNELKEITKEQVDKLTLQRGNISLVSDKLDSMIGKLNSSGFTLDENFSNQIKDCVRKTITESEKEKEYKDLMKTSYFKRLKDLAIFKDKKDIEIVDILLEILKGIDTVLYDEIKKIRGRRLKNV